MAEDSEAVVVVRESFDLFLSSGMIVVVMVIAVVCIVISRVTCGSEICVRPVDSCLCVAHWNSSGMMIHNELSLHSLSALEARGDCTTIPRKPGELRLVRRWIVAGAATLPKT